MHQKLLILISISFIFFLNSCSSKTEYLIEHPQIIDLPSPILKKLPLHVIAYFDEDFIRQSIEYETWSKSWDIPIDEINVSLFEYIFTNFFQKVSIIANSPLPTDESIQADLILKPSVIYIDFDTDWYKSILTTKYKVSFLLPNGEHIGSWEIWVDNSMHPVWQKSKKNVTDVIIDLLYINLRELSTRFMSEFCRNYHILEVFYEQCESDMQLEFLKYL